MNYNNDLRGISEVKIKREDLIKKLKENRDAHAAIYKDALEGYFVDTAAKLITKQKEIENKKIITSIVISVPKDHTEDYDRLIAMLEMSVDTELELNNLDFNRYVLDEWISVAEKNMLRSYALSSSNASTYVVG